MKYDLTHPFVIPEPNTGCWLWLGYLDKDGYGQTAVRKRLGGSPIGIGLHRVAYEQAFGKIPDGLTIDHLCQMRCCINPEHMEPVTQGENTRRRQINSGFGGLGHGPLTHCRKGHPFNEANTYWYKNTRACAPCRRAYERAYRAERKR